MLPFEILEVHPTGLADLSKSLCNLLIVYSIRKVTARMPAIKDAVSTEKLFFEFHLRRSRWIPGSFLLSAPHCRGDSMVRLCTADRSHSVVRCAPCCAWASLTF